jgi:hypothetical protein
MRCLALATKCARALTWQFRNVQNAGLTSPQMRKLEGILDSVRDSKIQQALLPGSGSDRLESHESELQPRHPN